jgi:MarR family 2-MHQ and catechol resistance regulon transcriptional repressor
LLPNLANAGLTPSQFGVLEALHHLGPMCQGELAHKILKSSGNITMVVDNLEKRGLVERQRLGDDRRFVKVHLTPQGQTLIAQVLPLHVGMVVQELSTLNHEEQDLLRRLCRKLGVGSCEPSSELPAKADCREV